MRTSLAHSIAALVLLSSSAASAADPAPESPAPAAAANDRGDLFPSAGHVSIVGASGLPLVGIAEAGIGGTNGFAAGAVFGVTPTGILTAGARPRVRIATTEHTALVFIAPMLWYPKANAPGPGNVGVSSWVLARPEVLWGGAVSDRFQLAGGGGVIAAASTEALAELAEGRKFAMPPYNGTTESRKGFAGGVWNTISSRASYAAARDTHVFAEASLVMKGVVPADEVGATPVIVTVGAQHSF
jgi:hypothetical protein